ncbi:MAG: hypothetical protein AAB649_05415, partial [Patescibacteria group bacterium]
LKNVARIGLRSLFDAQTKQLLNHSLSGKDTGDVIQKTLRSLSEEYLNIFVPRRTTGVVEMVALRSVISSDGEAEVLSLVNSLIANTSKKYREQIARAKQNRGSI